jgi:salicylate hydroxylase
VKLQPNSTCYQCSISSTDMLSNPLTTALIQEGGLQSWWGPNTHLICGRRSNGLSYEASFFIHPKPENPLPEYHISSSNSQEADNSRKGDLSQVKDNIGMYEERVKAFVNMIKPEDCLLWKVAQLPNLPSWVSKNGRIVLLGDAAHAMSPHLGQGAALSIEDGGALSHCLSRASSADEIPRAIKAYESVQKGRAESVKRLAEVSGVFKTLEEGKEREKRDRGFEERLQGQGEGGKEGVRYEIFRASGHLAWIYGWDFRTEAEKELEKVFPTEKGAKI